MTSPLLTTTTGRSGLHLQKISQLFALAFQSDPLHRSIILHETKQASSSQITHEQWVEHWMANARGKLAAGGEIVEAGNWAAAAIWFPPGNPPSPSSSSSPSPLPQTPPAIEYHDVFSAMKSHHLDGNRFWYLDLIGRDPRRTERGAVRALLEPYLAQAKRDGVPVWLEATNGQARDVYVHFGFRTVEEVVIGRGSLDGKGERVDGGEGVVMYGMIAGEGEGEGEGERGRG